MEQTTYRPSGESSFQESDWADSMLVQEYEKASQELHDKREADMLELEIGERLARGIVRNLEIHWLQQMMLKHHTGELGIEEITDKTRLDERLASEQKHTQGT